MEDVTAEMLDGNGQCDTVVSECLGVVSLSRLKARFDAYNCDDLQLLVHERMCESFLDARDRFLKPGGTVLPSAGTICLAPMEDKVVWEEAANKARFWDNRVS
jgi:histone-arginine methyltransferase CARM1